MFSFFRTPRPFKDLAHKVEVLVKGKLWLQAILGLGLGLAFGMLLGPDFGLVDPERATIITEWIALPGELFLRLIKMILIPLLAVSIIRGLGGATDINQLRSLGLKFFVYVVFTSTIAATIGITLARLIKPGSFINLPEMQQAAISIPAATNGDAASIVREIPKAIVDLIPANPLASATSGEMLGIVVFSIIVGIAFATRSNKKIQPLLTLLDGILDICMTIVQWAMWLVPLAVFGLVARMAAQVGVYTILGMGVYVATVLFGLFILLVLYVLLVWIFGRIAPWTFLSRIAGLQLVAFSTSSSAAVMPLSIKVAEEKLDVDEETAKVIVPLGATINMDGTALYQSIAILFLAQVSGVDLSLMQMILIVATLVLSSIGAPGTPGVGIVILTSIAANFGIPVMGQTLILGVDRILDMTRTAVNVTGDMTACVLFGRKR